MDEREIVTEGDPVLRKIAVPVPKKLFGSKELDEILERMQHALRKEKSGVAIAAPQIGVSYRIFLVRGFALKKNARNDADNDVAFINPVFVKKTKTLVEMDGEGCLSIPGTFGTTLRSPKVVLRAYDAKGKKFERSGSDGVAHIFQHEMDHLDGILFTDHGTNLHTIA